MISIPGFCTRFLYQVSILKQKKGTGTEVYGNGRIDFLTVENVFNHVNRAFLSEEGDYFREGKEGFDRFGNLSDSALQHCEVLSAFLYRGNPEMNSEQAKLAELTNPDNLDVKLDEAIVDADLFIGVSAPGILTEEMVAKMAKDPIVFAMANPVPEIMPDVAKKAGVRVIGTGRSDFPNQINNVLAFPGIFRGALDVRASDINDEMKMAAAQAIADIIKDDELNDEYIIPDAFDKRVAENVAKAVAKAARESGVARI